MFSYPGAFSAFSTKIDVAHAMGEIDDRTRDDLHTLRDLRNAFAHPPGLLHFDLDEMRKVLAKFHDYSPDEDQLTFFGSKLDELWTALHPKLDTALMMKVFRDMKKPRTSRDRS